MIRYSALYGTLVGILGASVGARRRAQQCSRRVFDDARWWLGLSVGLVAWLALCQFVVIDAAATDNLTELIAPPGGYGISGVAYLYMLLALFSLNAVLLTMDWRRASGWAATAVGSGVAVILGWGLLKLGLHPAVEKYGLVFSGVQFLLGPDRQTALPEAALFGRWVLVYFMGLGVVAAGLRLGQAWTRKPPHAIDGEGSSPARR
jgi:hypothetical protein